MDKRYYTILNKELSRLHELLYIAHTNQTERDIILNLIEDLHKYNFKQEPKIYIPAGTKYGSY